AARSRGRYSLHSLSASERDAAVSLSAQVHENSPRVSCRDTESHVALEPRPLRIANACERYRQCPETRGKESSASLSPRKAAYPLQRPFHRDPLPRDPRASSIRKALRSA